MAGWSDLPSQSEAPFERFQELADDVASLWDLDVHALALLALDDRVCLAPLIVEVLRHIQCALMPSRAEASSPTKGFIRVCAGTAVRRVSGKCFHNEELVVARQPGVGWGCCEIDGPTICRNDLGGGRA